MYSIAPDSMIKRGTAPNRLQGARYHSVSVHASQTAHRFTTSVAFKIRSVSCQHVASELVSAVITSYSTLFPPVHVQSDPTLTHYGFEFQFQTARYSILYCAGHKKRLVLLVDLLLNSA